MIKGFTLAEVLITLGIIGIVAAMTMPSLISDYKNKAIDAQFKRVYSNIYNAMKMIESRDGTLPQCYYTYQGGTSDPLKFSQCADFYDKITKEMHVIKICKGNAYNDDCIPEYQGVNTIKEYEDSASINGCGGYTQSNILNRNWAYIFNDGSILFTYDAVSNNMNNWSGVFAIDVNGKKPPNKWGHDIFSFSFNETKPGRIKMLPRCSLIEKGGKSPEELLINASK